MSRSTFPPLEDDFTRALLRSADGDEPSKAAYAKAATALGVGAGLGVGASLAAPSAVAAGAAGAARWSGITAARLAALGVSGALLVAGGALLLRSQPSRPPTAHRPNKPAISPSLPTVTATAANANESAPGSTRVEATPLVAPSAGSAGSANKGLDAASLPATPGSSPSVARSGAANAAGSARHRPGHGFSGSAQGASSGSSLAEQVQSLDRARVALGSGDAGTALREIAHYRKSWPHGVFLTEASVLEIEALAARGERSLAAVRAAAFVAAHPDSPQVGRLRALIPVEKL